MAPVTASTLIFLSLVIATEAKLLCDRQGCAVEMATAEKRAEGEDDAVAAAVRSRISHSSRFWGKRSQSDNSELKQRLAKSSLFWGKRSPLPALPDSEVDAAEELSADGADYSPVMMAHPLDVYSRITKGGVALPPKLTLSSRFWGRR